MPKRAAKPALPRAPLPKQTGGAHRTKKDTTHRKRKHKTRFDPTDPDCPKYDQGLDEMAYP